MIRRRYRWTFFIVIIGVATSLADGASTPTITIMVEHTLRNIDIYFIPKPLPVSYTWIKRKFTSDTEMFGSDPT